MKFPIILLSAFFVAALLDVGSAESKAAKKEGPSQTASLMSTDQAMYDCQSQYAGARGFLAKERWAFIERCFKASTGMYPFQAHANCTLRRC